MGKTKKKQKASNVMDISMPSQFESKLTANINGCELLRAAKECEWEAEERVRGI